VVSWFCFPGKVSDWYCACRFVPTFFEKEIESGIPTLTAEGKKAIEEELKEAN